MGLMKIVGPNGIVLEIDELQGRGLVEGGHAKLVEDPDPTEATGGQEPGTPPPGAPEGDGGAGPAGDQPADGKPRGNASREEWVEYALSNGKTEDDLQGLKQTEIRALFEPAGSDEQE